MAITKSPEQSHGTSMSSLLAAIAENARRMPDKASIVFPDGGVALTYDGLVRRAASFGVFLLQRGCHPGDKVAIVTHNTPEFFIALLGIMQRGLVAVPVDANLAPAELQRILAHAEPTAIVVDQAGFLKLSTIEISRMRIVIGADIVPGAVPFDPTHLPETAAVAPPSAPNGQLALLLYTSGTTGVPKGVMHSHETISARVQSISEWFLLSPDDRAFCMLPTHFGHGLICNCLTTLFYGGSLVISRPFDLDVIRSLWQSIERNEVAWFSTVPTIVRLLLQLAELRKPARPPSLRFVTCASAPLRSAEVEQFERAFGVPLLNCYGITETASWTAFSPNLADRDRSSVGTRFGCDIRTIDAAGNPLLPSEPGELQIRGPSVMLGYYKDPDMTAKTIRDGWFCTGDFGTVDAHGRVHILSRIKEVIIRAGLNIYPMDVDAVLLAHPAVAEAYTVGLANETLGERVAAVVVRKAGAEVTERDIIQHCRRELATYKCPDEVCFVEAVQKNSRGKVNRANLRPLFVNS
jgi:long-chain acyl-CoA synthetase